MTPRDRKLREEAISLEKQIVDLKARREKLFDRCRHVYSAFLEDDSIDKNPKCLVCRQRVYSTVHGPEVPLRVDLDHWKDINGIEM